MTKETVIVPSNIRYMNEWEDFYNNFPRFPHILDKQVPGCGFTEWCLTNPDNVILCSPRNMLILNKWEQHPNEVFRVYNDKYDVDPGVDKDLNKTGIEKETVPEKTFIEILNEMTKEERMSFTEELYYNLKEYFKKMDALKKPYKILVTYDSFRILKDVLIQHKNFETFQVIVDEFQTIFTDSRFKSDTELEFVNVLTGVEKVCYVSATPMIDKYLDRIDEFKDLPYYELDWTTEDPGRLKKPKLKVRIIPTIFKPAKEIIESYKSGKFETKMKKYPDGKQEIITSTEAMIYVNSVNNIIQIVKKNKLQPEEVNILCSNTKDNLAKIQDKLGKNFTIGKVPLKNEARKMFTFCTRTVYLGADFYSDNARSFILSDANLECLAVDISLDLPQILGRQRNDENPWKNEAEFYYKPFIKTGKEETKEILDKRISDKIELSEKHIKNYQDVQDKNAYLILIKDRVIDRHYKDDYVSINKHAGSTPIPVINKLVLIAEQRAYDIQQIDYADRFSVFNAIGNNCGLDENTLNEIRKVQELYNSVDTISEKLKIICEYPVSDEIRDIIIANVDDPKLSEYLELGIDAIKASSYNLGRLRKRFNLNCYDWKGIEEKVKTLFKPGDKISLSDAKSTLKTIYEEYNYPGKAKANDLEKWFKVKEVNINIDGKRSKGLELIKSI